MKYLKKFASIALALVMVLALCAPAFAATDKGSITVTNAAMGEKYKVVKLFDMTFDSSKEAYSYKIIEGIDIPDGSPAYNLNDYFEKDSQGYVTIKDAGKGATDGELSTEAVDAIKAWAAEQDGVKTETAGTNGVLTFTGLDYGYYVVVSRTENGGAISVTSTNPDVEIVDKNKNTLTPGKTVETGEESNQVAAVGETVTYTVSLTTVNWIGEGKDAEQVISYTVADTLPDFLDNVTVTSIKVGDTDIKNNDGSVPQFENKSMTITWADKTNDLKCKQELGEGHTAHTDACYKWDSRYANGSELVITYTAVVNEKILGAEKTDHTNKVTFTPNKIVGSGDPVDKETEIYTATIVINKHEKDKPNTKLEGAKFVLRDDDKDDAKYYKWTPATYAEDGTTKLTSAKGEWVTDEADATVYETDEDGAAKIEGLTVGTYYLEETEAPKGYNKLSARVPVNIAVPVEGEGEDAHAAKLTANISQPAEVENSTGALLPSTGGIGTTIFYVLGGVLVLGAVILLIAKRRTSVDDE